MDTEDRQHQGLEPVYTAEELASLLKISLSMVYKLRRSGALPYIQVGSGYRFAADDVRRFMRGEQASPKLKIIAR